MTHPTPRVIGFDGDDTLWHNETIFSVTQERFRELLLRHAPEADVDARLLATERRNLAAFGYGIKGFMLSMVETAIDVTEGRIPARDISTILDFGRAMLLHPVELLDGARPTLEALAERYELMLVTKGDLFDQESKIARSGLAPLFSRVEILSEKDETSYRRLLARHGVAPTEFVMVGNSMRSDVLPPVALGARAVHIPYHVTWALEHADAPAHAADRVWTLAAIGELPALISAWVAP
jgi:putative hydrolase of the HAD superfamily